VCDGQRCKLIKVEERSGSCKSPHHTLHPASHAAHLQAAHCGAGGYSRVRQPELSLPPIVHLKPVSTDSCTIVVRGRPAQCGGGGGATHLHRGIRRCWDRGLGGECAAQTPGTRTQCIEHLNVMEGGGQ